MGALSHLTENNTPAPSSQTDYRESVINTGARILEESLADKYPALASQLESGNSHEQFMAASTAIMCERTERQVESVRSQYGESTVTQGLGQLNNRLMDVVRIFYPNQVAALITDVQPLDRKTGEIFVIKPKYSNTASGVTAGQEVFRNATNGTYASEYVTSSLGTGDGTDTTFGATLSHPLRPGTVKVYVAGVLKAADNGLGNVSGTGITGTVDYTTGVLALTWTTAPANGAAITAEYSYDSEKETGSIRELEFGLDLIPVTAKQHPLKIKWSVQADLAASAHLNLDVPDILSNLAAQFVRTERDTRIISAISASVPSVGSNMTFDAAPKDGYTLSQRYGEIELKLNHAESTINSAMGRGGVSWVLCGYNAAEVFKNCPSFQSVPNPAPIGPVKIGTLRDGTVDVIRVPSMGTNDYVVGYKGYMPGDSAVILADWVPIYFTPTFQAPELVNARGLMSLYDMFVNEKNYFVKGTVTNFAA